MSEFQQLKKTYNHIGPPAGIELTSNMIPCQKFLSRLNVKLYTFISELQLRTAEGAVKSVLPTGSENNKCGMCRHEHWTFPKSKLRFIYPFTTIGKQEQC